MDIHRPSPFLRSGTRINHDIVVVGTDSPSKNPWLTPFTSLGGDSASAISDSIIPSSGPPPDWSCRIVANACARVRKVAATSLGRGMACALLVSVVSTCSRVEKKVERSGRRGGCGGSLGLGVETLCSTFNGEFHKYALVEAQWKYKGWGS